VSRAGAGPGLLAGLLAGLLGAAPGCTAPEPPMGDFPLLERDDGGGEDALLDGGDDGGLQADGAPAGPLTPDGTWVLWTETVTCVKVLGIELNGVAEQLSLVSLEERGGGVVAHRYRPCHIAQSPIVGLATVIPDRLTEAVPEQTWLALLDGTEAGAGYQSQTYIELWAVRLDDPEQEPLPVSADDPRVYDMDQDGHPGGTLVLGNDLCRMYVIQRAMKRWKGRVTSAVRVEGGGRNSSEQVLLEATNAFCASAYLVRHLEPLNRFALQRVDGRHGAPDLDTDQDGQISCAEVRAHGLASFGPAKADNSLCTPEEN
jgi:hypothetical protein